MSPSVIPSFSVLCKAINAIAFYSRTTKEAIARLKVKCTNIEDSDRFKETKTPSSYDPNFEKKMEAARQGMKKYRNALVELAE